MTKLHGTFEYQKRSIDGYSRMIKTHIESGSSAYLMTFMFDQLNGNERTRMTQMKKEIERVYSILINHSLRYRSMFSVRNKLPILIACPDYPVGKYDKQSIADVMTNDGLHFHAILLMPPLSRLRDSIVEHFASKKYLYINGRLRRIDIRPITHDIDQVTDYVFKSLKNGRISDDNGEAVLILNGQTFTNCFP